MKIENITIPVYVGSLAIVHIVYIAVFLGIFVAVPKYIHILNIGIQAFLCLILLLRFHPFQNNPKLQPGDNMFIFGVVIIVFTNVVLVELTKIPIINEWVSSINNISKQNGIKLLVNDINK
jgi:hypothetical protein